MTRAKGFDEDYKSGFECGRLSIRHGQVIGPKRIDQNFGRACIDGRVSLTDERR